MPAGGLEPPTYHRLTFATQPIYSYGDERALVVVAKLILTDEALAALANYLAARQTPTSKADLSLVN